MWKAFLEFVAALCKPPEAVAAPANAPTIDQPPLPEIDVGQVQQLLGRVGELTATVAQDVGQHNKSVQAISQELTSVAQSDPSAVAAIVCRLLVANQELQGRLERAEQTLQSHSRELNNAVETARKDPLTGLMNRRALDETLNTCVVEFQQQERPVTLMILDVDRFKQFNDAYGHLIGDKCLIHVAAALRSRLEASDFVFRFGGEEFVIVFCGQTINKVRQRAESIRRTISQRPIIIDGCSKPITASGGLAELVPGETIVDWIKRADAALYAAKGGGRDCSFEMNGAGAEKIVYMTPEERHLVAAKDAVQRPVFEAAAEIAAEAFADTGFVPSVARRIAEWRRGGTTLTVLLARLDCESDAAGGDPPGEQQGAMRAAMQAARVILREMDLLTRWQSDGLAILLPNTSARDARSVARRLKNALVDNSIEGQVSLSMGIAEGLEGNDAKRVLERAWLALNLARSSGPGGVAVHDGLKSVALKVMATAK